MPASPKFKTIITDYGKQRLIAAMSPGGTKLTLTQMAVGDGGGNPTNPDTTSAALVNEVWRAAVNSVSVDKTHSNIIIVELLIPAEVGGFWIREAGIYDEFNKLVAVCSLPASEKPLLEQGSGRAQTVRMTLVISDMSTINITIDSTTIIATNDYVDNSLKEHEKSRNHPDATLTDKGFVKLYSSTTSLDETMAATPKAVKIAMDNASARLAKERNLADLTNIPLARQSLQLGNSATRNLGTTPGTVAAGNDNRIIGTKKAIDDTQTGLAAQGVMWISTADDLSNMPSGARRFARNNTGVTVLPAAGYFFLEVLAKRDTANGSCILATSDTRDVWIGFRYTVPDEAGFTWIQLNQNVENLGLTDTVNRALHVNSDGDIRGSLWGDWLSHWLYGQFATRDNNINARATVDYVNQTFVRDVRAGNVESAQVWRAYGYNDQAPYVITGVINGNTDDLIDNLTRRPLQKNINGVWYNIGFI